MFGLYDTKDNCWLGNSEGPLLYEDVMLARTAARILDVRLGNPAGRTRATRFISNNVVYKDDVIANISAERAIEMLENGETL